MIQRDFVTEIVCKFTFPKLDARVTIEPNHLLKCPLSIHPLTKKLCIPIDGNFEDFDPDSAPTVNDLVIKPDLFTLHKQNFIFHMVMKGINDPSSILSF